MTTGYPLSRIANILSATAHRRLNRETLLTFYFDKQQSCEKLKRNFVARMLSLSFVRRILGRLKEFREIKITCLN